mmetsp:Transcript_7052/g.10407  ORF Transcript_7052/g.10407 Transcript_7052/m.10407 type:complete len:112 (-) Transcript_7052:50-385(-)
MERMAGIKTRQIGTGMYKWCGESSIWSPNMDHYTINTEDTVKLIRIIKRKKPNSRSGGTNQTDSELIWHGPIDPQARGFNPSINPNAGDTIFREHLMTDYVCSTWRILAQY